MAKENGILTIALTDHDTVKGLEAALRTGNAEGIKVIPGIEISVEDHGAHILGYGIDWKNPELLASLEQSEQERIESAKKTLENLRQFGFVVEWEDVLRETTGSVIGRPHISRASAAASAGCPPSSTKSLPSPCILTNCIVRLAVRSLFRAGAGFVKLDA